RFAGQMNRERAIVADAELRAESAAREFADHADLFLRQIEHVGRFVADAEHELGRGVERQLLVAPVGDDAVRFHRHMSLNLRAVLAREDVIGLCETLLYIASRTAAEAATGGPAKIAFLRQARRRATAACSRRLLRRPGEDDRRVFLHRCFERRDVWESFVFDAYEF